jgi:hypothetical protein
LRWQIFSSEDRILRNVASRVEPSSVLQRHSLGLDIFFDIVNWRGPVPNVIRFPQSISKPSVASDIAATNRSARDLFVSVALFSAVGLLVSLVLMLIGVPGAWY